MQTEVEKTDSGPEIEVDQVTRMMDQLGIAPSDTIVRIYRCAPGSQAIRGAFYLGTCTRAAFDPEMIRQKWAKPGANTFYLNFITAEGKAAGGGPLPLDPDARPDEAPAAPVAAKLPEDDRIGRLEKLLADMAVELRNNRQPATAQPAIDPAVLEIVKAALARPEATAPALPPQFMQLAIDQLTKAGKPQKSSLQELMDAKRFLDEIGSGRAAEENQTVWERLADKYGPMVLELAQAKMGGAPAATVRALPAATGETAHGEVENGNPAVNGSADPMKELCGQILEEARKGTKPFIVVGMLEDNLSARNMKAVAQAFADADFLQKLYPDQAARLGSFAPWFAMFRTVLGEQTGIKQPKPAKPTLQIEKKKEKARR